MFFSPGLPYLCFLKQSQTLKRNNSNEVPLIPRKEQLYYCHIVKVYLANLGDSCVYIGYETVSSFFVKGN